MNYTITNAKRPKMSDRPGKISGLTITRKKLQRLLIRVGNVDVWVAVNRIEATHVSLTIQAPADVHIAREEILIYDDVSPLSADACGDRSQQATDPVGMD